MSISGLIITQKYDEGILMNDASVIIPAYGQKQSRQPHRLNCLFIEKDLFIDRSLRNGGEISHWARSETIKRGVRKKSLFMAWGFLENSLVCILRFAVLIG